MRSRIVVVNGPAGVGKSTVGRLLAGQVASGACIHGDALRAFVVTRRDGVVPRGLTYRNAGVVAANFAAAGYELVVVDFIFEHEGHVRRFVEACTAPVPIHLFTLWATLETVGERERGRPDRDPLGERVEACYRTLEANLTELGEVIETEGRSAEAVVVEILQRCEAGHGRVEGRALARQRPYGA